MTNELKTRALQILDRAKNKPIGEMLRASALASRMVARSAQLAGDMEAYALHMRTASKFAHLADKRGF